MRDGYRLLRGTDRAGEAVGCVKGGLQWMEVTVSIDVVEIDPG